MSKYYTAEGLKIKEVQLKRQEDKVREVGRQAGEEAGLSCDWHDNFGYEDAKRRLEMEASLLKTLQEERAGAMVVEVSEQSDVVALGVTVTLAVNGEERVVTIGAFGESEPGVGLISYTSPLASVLLRMRSGDSKTTLIGGKTTLVEVIDIFPPSYKYHRILADFKDRAASE